MKKAAPKISDFRYENCKHPTSRKIGIVAVFVALVAGLPFVLIARLLSCLSSLYIKAIVLDNNVQVRDKKFPEVNS